MAKMRIVDNTDSGADETDSQSDTFEGDQDDFANEPPEQFFVADVTTPDDFERKRSRSIQTIPISNDNESVMLERARCAVEEALLRALISEGTPRDEMLQVFQVNENGLRVIEKRLFNNDGTRFIEQATAFRYYIYALQQEQCIRDLEYLVEVLMRDMKVWHDGYRRVMKFNPESAGTFPGRPSSQAIVLAIKTKSDIYDKVLKTGVELGIVEKRVKENRIIGNINLSAMDVPALRTLLDSRIKVFKRLVDKKELPPVYQKMLDATKKVVRDKRDAAEKTEYVNGKVSRDIGENEGIPTAKVFNDEE